MLDSNNWRNNEKLESLFHKAQFWALTIYKIERYFNWHVE